MISRLVKLLYIGVTIIVALLLTSCLNTTTIAPSGQAADPATESTTPLESNPSLPNPEPATLQPESWQVRCLSSWIDDGSWRRMWELTDDKLWCLNAEGIQYFDLNTNLAITVSKSTMYNTMFLADNCVWFTNNYLWGWYEDFPEDQVPLARFDLTSEQYYEYPTDTFTGVNVTVLESLGKTMVCTDNQLYQYNKATDQFIEIPEYGKYVWRITGDNSIFATYEFDITNGLLPTEDSLKLYKANGELVKYKPAECLPDIYVTEMSITGDELFIWWGGEGEPTGVACLNTQTGTWTHYIDIMSDSDFYTPHEYTLISESSGEIWTRAEDVVYLPLKGSVPNSLLKFSFLQQQFECIYTTEEIICDAIPFQNGDIIAQSNGLVFCDSANNIENILENMLVLQTLRRNQDTVLAITDQGVFECKRAK